MLIYRVIDYVITNWFTQTCKCLMYVVYDKISVFIPSCFWENWRSIQLRWRNMEWNPEHILTLHLFLMKYYLGRSVKSKFFRFHFVYFPSHYLCSVNWTLQMYRLSGSFHRHQHQRYMIPLSGSCLTENTCPSLCLALTQSPDDQRWSFIHCKGIALPNRHVDKSHVSWRSRQVHKLKLALTKHEYYS